MRQYAVQRVVRQIAGLKLGQLGADGFGRRGLAQPPGDIADVAQRRRLVALEDFGFLVLSLATAHGSEEVRKVVFALAVERAYQVAFQVKHRAAGDDALGAFEDCAPFVFVAERLRLQAARLGDNRLVAEVEDADLRVGRLAGVLVAQTAAVTYHRAAEASYAEPPAADIERVDVVVAQFAAAGVPDPMPIVVQFLPRQRNERRGALEQVVVDIRRHLIHARLANRAASAIHDAASQLDFAELALPHVFDGLSIRAAGTVLMSALTDAA